MQYLEKRWIDKKSNTSNHLGKWEIHQKTDFWYIKPWRQTVLQVVWKIWSVLFFGLHKATTQKIWKCHSLCRQNFTTQIKYHKTIFEENDDVVLNWFPKGLPQFNTVEKVWMQGKYNLLVSQYLPSLNDLKRKISRYYRASQFNLNITKYMQREDSWRIYVREYMRFRICPVIHRRISCRLFFGLLQKLHHKKSSLQGQHHRYNILSWVDL